MKKTILLFCLALGACSSSPQPENCPKVNLSRESNRQYFANDGYDAFQLNLSGYESYCYVEPSNHQNYMIITPIFKVRRLQDSSLQSVAASVYLKTAGKENYIDRQTYYQSLFIPSGQKEQTIKGNTIKLRVAQPPYEDFSVELGLNLSDYALSKTRSMFDINYRYLSPQDLAEQNVVIEEQALEIAPDEKVVYCSPNHPVVVKKDFKINPCN